MRFKPGQRVTKVGGDYQLTGTVVAAFEKLSGQVRYVVEADVPKGLLHIYSDANLELLEDTPEEKPEKVEEPKVEEPPAHRLRSFIQQHLGGKCKVLSQGSACTCALCDLERLYDALRWYEAEAVALATNMTASKDTAVLASVHVLSLDAGLRSKSVLGPEPSTPVAQCTESDSWNCKYCNKTDTCLALKDPRNFKTTNPPTSN